MPGVPPLMQTFRCSTFPSFWSLILLSNVFSELCYLARTICSIQICIQSLFLPTKSVMAVFRKFSEFRIFWPSRKYLHISFFSNFAIPPDLEIKKIPKNRPLFATTFQFWLQPKLFGKSPCKACIWLVDSRTPEQIGNYCYHSPAGHLLATLCAVIVVCKYAGSWDWGKTTTTCNYSSGKNNYYQYF